MKVFLVFVLSISLTTVSYAQFKDDFSDGDFTNNPTWLPDVTGNWIVSSDSLRSNSKISSSTFFIATPSQKATNAQWEFYIHLNFNTSSANYVDVFLTASVANLISPTLNGYFVRIGGTADKICLYKMNAGAASLLIDGNTGDTNHANNTLKIKVIRDAANNWTLSQDLTGTGDNYTSQPSALDNTFISSSYFGIRITQSTSSFFNKHFFDDFYVGKIIQDTIPPTIDAATATSTTQLQVLFSEPLDKASSETTSNYQINNGIGSPQSAVLQADQKTVALTFTHPFANGVTNLLSVSGVEDIHSNAIIQASQSFHYFTPSPVSVKDIIINEFLPDPSPIIGLPAHEFVEIYNRSNNPIDVAGWKITDRTSVATLPSQIILPKEYWIITSATAAIAFNSYGHVLGATNFPTLNNGGDKIILLDPSDNKIDSVKYNLNWYNDADKQQGGWSLETFNPDALTYDSSNWSASIDPTGGTPSHINSLFGKNPDSSPPKWLTTSVQQQNTLSLTFNERLDATPTSILSHYATLHNGSPASVALSSDQKTITLTFPQAFQNGLRDTLSVSGLTDLTGNIMPLTKMAFLYFVPLPVHHKDVIITEIMADPSPPVSLPEAEYLEILNRSANPIDLINWKVIDAGATGKLPSRIIMPGQYCILASTSTSSLFSSFGNTLPVVSFPSLNNDGEYLILQNENGLTIDSLYYTTDWYHSAEKEQGGWSLELIDPANMCSTESNWIASDDESGGTPGRQNSVLASKPDVIGPTLSTTHVVTTKQLTLVFDEPLEASLISTSFSISPLVAINQATLNPSGLRQIDLTLKEDLQPRQLYTIQVKGLHDCTGNLIQEEFNHLSFALPEQADSLDIILNEVLFNPRPGGVDFVELYNNSDKYISIKDWKFANIKNDTVQNLKTITLDDYIIPPATYRAFTSNPQVLMEQFPQAVRDNLYKATLPSMNDDEGSIVIVTDKNKVVDAFSYSQSYQSPLLNSVEGVSLERISFTEPTNESTNWKSASAASGFGTPGYHNSNSRPEQYASDQSVVVEPEIFSPQVAGQDFARILYHFDESGYVANINIIDAQGRLTKTIANNETLSIEGFFRWEGDRDDGAMARHGYYLVWFQIYSADGLVKTYRKRVILARN